MSRRPSAWLAWLLWVLIVALGEPMVIPYQVDWFQLTHLFSLTGEGILDALGGPIFVLAIAALATVGAIVASLRPKNGVGWLCLALSLIAVLISWQPTDGTLRGFANVLAGLAFALMVPPLAVTLVLLILPNGRLLSRWWWVVVGMALVWPTLGTLMESLQAHPVAELVWIIGFSISLVALLASVVAIVLRWLRS